MISALVVLFIVILIQIFIIGLLFSKVVVDIEEYDISYNVDYAKKLNINNLKINLKIYLFKKIKILKVKIYKDYCEIFKIKIHLNVFKKLTDEKQNEFIYVVKNMGKLKPKIKNINLELNIGTESTMITTFLIPTISTAISALISNYMEENNNLKPNMPSNCNLKIMPRYVNTNNFILKGSMQVHIDTIKILIFMKSIEKLRPK